MPTKRRRVTPTSVKRARVNPKARNKIVAVPRNKLAFPSGIRTKLRYTGKFAFDIGSETGILQKTFRANSIFDPDYSLGGHQPRGTDQYAEIYNMYTVHSSSCAITWCYQGYLGPSTEGTAPLELIQSENTVAAAGVPALSPVIVGLHKGTDQLLAGSAEEQIEKDKTQWQVLTPHRDPITQKTTVRMSDFYGTTGDLTGRDGFAAALDADPVNSAYFEVFAGRMSGSTDGSKCKLWGLVNLEYDVTFSEPKALTQST
uniref:Capsid protein n=1 Tax=uncultured marine virus TaxID=186617 RepID=S4TE54_9VIRU|nr:hypothetical protein [uncultured marine virus]